MQKLVETARSNGKLLYEKQPVAREGIATIASAINNELSTTIIPEKNKMSTQDGKKFAVSSQKDEKCSIQFLGVIGLKTLKALKIKDFCSKGHFLIGCFGKKQRRMAKAVRFCVVYRKGPLP